jgi:integrase
MAKDKTTGNLQQRGHQYYLKMAIPRTLRRFFLSSTGKPQDQISQPLGDSYSFARIECARRVAIYRELFERLYLEPTMTPEQVKEIMRGAEFADDPTEMELAPGVDPRLLYTNPVGRYREQRKQRLIEQHAKIFETLGSRQIGNEPVPAPAHGETISQAADVWFAQMERDAESQPLTIAGHRNRVHAFIGKCGDMPLIDVTRAIASDFVDGLNVSQRTRKQYRTSLKCLFESAKDRGRFTGDNPFEKKGKRIQGESYKPFTIAELQTLFDALPRSVSHVRHSPETALPWVALIALYTGMRLEEIAQLTTADIRPAGANGATVTVIDIHNGGTNKLKNETSARLVPVHSELVRAGLLKYVEAVKAGPLFPGLKRRESKGGKVGARLGELFRKKLVALGLKSDGLCFHSFRHTVAGRLDAAEVRQSDAARVLGHAIEGMSYGTYSQEGPGLKQVAAVVEKIVYEGLRL